MARNRLAIIPDVTHYDILDANRIAGVASAVVPFLGKPVQVSTR